MDKGVCEHSIKALQRKPKYLIKAIVRSPMRSMPPLWDNVDVVAYSEADVYDFILAKHPAFFMVYVIVPEVNKTANQWSEEAKGYKEREEAERERQEYEKLKKKFEGG